MSDSKSDKTKSNDVKQGAQQKPAVVDAKSAQTDKGKEKEKSK